MLLVMLKKYGYPAFLGLLSALLIITCFIAEFVWVMFAVVLIVSPFLSIAQLAGVWLFVTCFDGLFVTVDDTLGVNVITFSLCLMLVGNYALQVMAGKKQVNFLVTLPLTVFGVYLILPMHVMHGIGALALLLQLLALYVLYACREQLQFTNLVKVFCVGLILSGLFRMLAILSPYLNKFMLNLQIDQGEYRRFMGLCYNCHRYASLSLLAIWGLLTLQYRRQINEYWFYGCFVLIYLFAFQAVSQPYVIALVIMLVVYGGLLMRQRGQQAVLPLGVLIGIVILIAVMFQPATKAFLALKPDGELLTNEYLQGVAEGQFKITYDEHGDKLYDNILAVVTYDYTWQGLFGKPLTLFFGYGLVRAVCVDFQYQNACLGLLWHHGLVGVALLVLALAMVLWSSKIKLSSLKQHGGEIILIAIPLLVGLIANVYFFAWIPGAILITACFTPAREATKLTPQRIQWTVRCHHHFIDEASWPDVDFC